MTSPVAPTLVPPPKRKARAPKRLAQWARELLYMPILSLSRLESRPPRQTSRVRSRPTLPWVSHFAALSHERRKPCIRQSPLFSLSLYPRTRAVLPFSGERRGSTEEICMILSLVLEKPAFARALI